jgi:hypothetical protein
MLVQVAGHELHNEQRLVHLLTSPYELHTAPMICSLAPMNCTEPGQVTQAWIVPMQMLQSSIASISLILAGQEIRSANLKVTVAASYLYDVRMPASLEEDDLPGKVFLLLVGRPLH